MKLVETHERRCRKRQITGERGGVGYTRAGENTRPLHTNSEGDMAEDRDKVEPGRGIPVVVEELDRPDGKLGRNKSRGKEKRRKRERRGHGENGNRPQRKLGPVPPEILGIEWLTQPMRNTLS
ncbi:hypothetical protein C1H46_010876 [Malus baccata]|uniref:Uncharacterized protein n=1 Tax=Malus baccata TaxID=106549 RepID=A0A540MXN0_MALBA|nr:hypothetical protein C1H46_010876 [Malus baccata]